MWHVFDADEGRALGGREMEPDRKKVKLVLNNTMQKRIPIKSATTPKSTKRSKHYLAHFKGNSKDGSATKATSSQTKAVIQENPGKIKIRHLGATLDEIPDDSPSLLVEVDNESDIMKEIVELKRKTTILEKSHKELEASNMKLVEFQSDALEMAVRAFLDKVLESFYIHAKKDSLGFEERSHWLKSPEAQEFVQGKSSMPLFGKEVKVSGRLLKVLKGMKLDSSLVSQSVAHSSKPFRVAIALLDLEVYKTKADYHWIFQKAFGMTPEEMVTKWKAGVLEP